MRARRRAVVSLLALSSACVNTRVWPADPGALGRVPSDHDVEFRFTAPRTLNAWLTIGQTPDLVAAILASLGLAVLTSLGMLLLLVPTMIWIRLRLPYLTRAMEFLCLLPLTIPAIVLVAGLAPIYLWMNLNINDSILTLAFVYLILVLPFAYRALFTGLAAIDVKTLAEAARSLGANWGTVMLRVIVPNMSVAILNACLLSVAVVLGEFTIANLLNYVNLQVAIALLGRANATVSIAVAVASLLFAFILLVILSFAGRPRARVHLEDTGLPYPGAAGGGLR